VFLIFAASGAPSPGGSIFGGNYAMKRSGKLIVLLISAASGTSSPGASIFGGTYAIKGSGHNAFSVYRHGGGIFGGNCTMKR
jgi:hypothetical protein